MTMTIDQLWLEMEREPSGECGFLQRRYQPQSSCPMFVSLLKPGNSRFFRFEVEGTSIPGSAVYPQSRGIRVEPVNSGESPGNVSISIKLVDPKCKDMFSVIINEIVDIVIGEQTHHGKVVKVLEHLSRWQSFLKKFGHNGLSKNEQQGLYAELLFLNNVLFTKIGKENAIKAWTGPTGTNQDFELGRTAFEIKSSSAGNNVKLRVSNIRQLDDTGLKHLIVYCLLLDSRRGSTSTLPDLVDSIRHSLDQSSSLITMFDEKLHEAGYHDSQEELYTNRTYKRRSEYYFHVKDNFPRLLENNIPPGIQDVKYSIELSACLPFKMDSIDSFLNSGE